MPIPPDGGVRHTWCLCGPSESYKSDIIIFLQFLSVIKDVMLTLLCLQPGGGEAQVVQNYTLVYNMSLFNACLWLFLLMEVFVTHHSWVDRLKVINLFITLSVCDKRCHVGVSCVCSRVDRLRVINIK